MFVENEIGDSFNYIQSFTKIKCLQKGVNLKPLTGSGRFGQIREVQGTSAIVGVLRSGFYGFVGPMGSLEG